MYTKFFCQKHICLEKLIVVTDTAKMLGLEQFIFVEISCGESIHWWIISCMLSKIPIAILN